MSTLVDEDLIGDVELGGKTFIDLSGSAPVVVFGVVALNRALDGANVHSGIREAVEWSDGRDVGELDGGRKRQGASHAVSSDCMSAEY